jgi:hypothetical protein
MFGAPLALRPPSEERSFVLCLPSTRPSIPTRYRSGQDRGELMDYIPSGTCEKIDLADFSRDQKCIPLQQRSLIRQINKQFWADVGGESLNSIFSHIPFAGFIVPGFLGNG